MGKGRAWSRQSGGPSPRLSRAGRWSGSIGERSPRPLGRSIARWDCSSRRLVGCVRGVHRLGPPLGEGQGRQQDDQETPAMAGRAPCVVPQLR
jgi:hypothetical protein